MSRIKGKLANILALTALLTVGLKTTLAADAAAAGASASVLLWDTQAPLGDKLNPADRSHWKLVPNDLMLLEKDPAKASSDPGYYGRDYAFGGDAVVETPTLTAVFSAAKGCVAVFSKESPTGETQGADAAGRSGTRIVDVSPLLAEGPSAISQVELVRNADDEIVLNVTFSCPGAAPATCLFSFDRSGIAEVKPAQNMKHVRLSGPLAYGVVPAFIGDDLILGGSEWAGTNTAAIPAENMLLGLVAGENQELVVTWPQAKQRVSLRFGETGNIAAVDLDDGAQPFYLAALSAPGIWHKQALTPDFLEKDVKIQWKPPFPARWKTQLYEEELKTSYVFRESKGQIWRGVAGMYEYPVWFEDGTAHYYLGKKVQPKGESLIYCLEGRDTPLVVRTPADILKQTLGRPTADSILDFVGRKLRTHHRRGGTGVRRACTCGCTEAIQAVFQAGEEVSQKEYIQGALEDMIYFVHCHVGRINDYRRLADGVLKTIQQTRQSAPELKPFLDGLEEIARQIPEECDVQKPNMKDFAYADDLSKRTMALTARQDPNNLKAYMELLKAWRDMGGAQDYVVAKCFNITRSLCQAAGYGCASLPQAVPLAEQIRAECRQTLRNPDGYEVWANY